MNAGFSSTKENEKVKRNKNKAVLLIRVVYRLAEHVVDFGLVNVLFTSSAGLVG